MSRGTVSRFVYDAKDVTWDGTAFFVKGQITDYNAGPVKAGGRVKFELNDITGLEPGDRLQGKITSKTKDVSDKDSSVIEYAIESNQQAVFKIGGIPTNPTIKFIKVENRE